MLTAAVSLLTLVAYSFTITGSADFYDSAELALRASQLGATHAPGAPLHTLLGFVFVQPFSEPAFGTNILSALSVSLATAMMAMLLWHLTRDAWATVLGPPVFAFSYQVWGNAVVTELYGLSILCLATAFWLAWRWRGDSSRMPVSMSIAYSISLSAYFGNILLLPAFGWLVIESSRHRARDLTVFSIVVLAAVMAIGAANYLLASNQPPFGAESPDSLAGIWRYMSGSQYDPLAIREWGFYVSRLSEHAGIFSRYFLYIGILPAIYGAYVLARLDASFSRFLLIVFVIYMGYYTLFGPGDYYTMVVPVYFIMALWIAFGLHGLVAASFHPLLVWSGRVLVMGYILVLITSQADERRQTARATTVQDYIDATTDVLPADSIAVAAWREFTVLNYQQQLHGFRPDVNFIVGARTTRRYSHGVVEDYLDLVDAEFCHRPIVTNKLRDELGDKYDTILLMDDPRWYRLKQKSEALEDRCRGVETH